MEKSKYKILFIEDEPDILDIYSSGLKMAAVKIEIDAVSRGKVAMEKILQIQEGKAKKPELVLLDLILPDINGFEILYSLRNHNATKSIPVFVLSNYTSEALRNIVALKPDKIFLKAETSPRQLVDAVTQQLKLSKSK